jgi:hypothetical protein
MQIGTKSKEIAVLPPFSHYTIPIQYKSDFLWMSRDGLLLSNIAYTDYTKSVFINGLSERVTFVPLWKSFLLPFALFAGGFLLFISIIRVISYVEKRSFIKRKNSS